MKQEIPPTNNLTMENNNISIKTIDKLRDYNFFIPSYQRGYRWTEQQVTDLLDDINEFSPKEIPDSNEKTNEKTWYCLQPIVVKQKDEKDKKWEVIDGQQRLTTIYLILHYLNQGYVENRRKKLFGLEYETRKGSADFLKDNLNGEINNSNIDYYFISSAYEKICCWFKKKDEDEVKQFDISSFESKLYSSTKVIWYSPSQDEDAIDIFTRINSGKIPLTNAELIKALFLNSSNFANADMEKLRLKQLEIASEWDRMEYALQDDSFWYFINKEENNLPTRIEFIFDLMVIMTGEDSKRDDYSTFRFFNEKFKDYSEKEINDNWQEIKKYFQTLEEWYNDRELYHKIGFLISRGTNIEEILQGKKDQTKTAFRESLNDKIIAKIKGVDIDELEYGDNSRDKIRDILLLHNIQTMLNNKNETSRFPFDRYKKEFWDVEHIHAIASETSKVKVKKEEQQTWLENNSVLTDNHKDQDLNDKIYQILNGNEIDETEFEEIINYVLGEEDHSLRNLCLLDSRTNRAYKNDSFKAKRKEIIEREKQGTFIPICTKNVFMKYYTTDAKDLEIWNENDREKYFIELKEVLKKYLATQTEQ